MKQLMEGDLGLGTAEDAEAMLSFARKNDAPQGVNEYGLDVDYFNKKLSQLVRDVRSYTPAEMARALARLAAVADETVLAEPEFARAELEP